MFEIKYSITNTYDETAFDYKSADDTSLRYRLFLGGLTLRTNEAKIDLNWKWIPLLDFAACLLSIYSSLLDEHHHHQQFEFTESDGKLFIDKHGKKISISTSFSEEKMEVEIDSFWLGLYNFYSELITDIKKKYPGIEENADFFKYESTINRLSI